MGFMDKVKGLLKGREKQVKSGIDTVSEKVEEKVGPQHAAQVDEVADKAKEAVDKLGGNDPATPDAPATGAPAAGAPGDGAPASTEPPVSPPPQAAPPSPPTGPPA